MQRSFDGESGEKGPGSGLAEALGRDVAAAGLPGISPSRLLTQLMSVHSVEEEWAGRSLGAGSWVPLTWTQDPSWVLWHGRGERQERKGWLYPGQSRNCPANMPATLPLKEEPAGLPWQSRG